MTEFNRHKFMLDWDTSRGDHQILPLDEKDQRRKRVQKLRAQVSDAMLERKVS